MNELRQSLEEENSSRFAFLKGPLAAGWAPIPLRLIVGYGFLFSGSDVRTRVCFAWFGTSARKVAMTATTLKGPKRKRMATPWLEAQLG